MFTDDAGTKYTAAIASQGNGTIGGGNSAGYSYQLSGVGLGTPIYNKTRYITTVSTPLIVTQSGVTCTYTLTLTLQNRATYPGINTKVVSATVV